MSSRKEFNEMFYKTCKPLLTEFEEQRMKIFFAYKIRATILGIILFCLLCLFLYEIAIQQPRGSIFLVIIIAAIMLGDYYKQKKNFETKIKHKIMPVFCNALGDFQWSSGNIVNYDLFVNTGIVPKNWYRAQSDDIFTGKHNDVSIEIAEVTYWEKGDKNNYVTFQGAVVLLDMNKIFHGHTLVTSDTALHLSPINGLKHTILEDSRFEKIFDVFTNDEVEARYLLTPTFMERLTKIKKTFMAAQISCAFYMNKLFISINTRKDMFYLGVINKKEDDYRQFIQIYTEITSIIELIDQLKLDQKIGL